MGKFSVLRRKVSVQCTKGFGARVADFMRIKYPHKTAECVSADTGIDTKTVCKWLEQSSAPGGVAMFHLTMVYGPEFLFALSEDAPPWLSAVRREQKAASIQRRIDALNAERASL